jgi:hypothetical protein
VDHRVRVIVAVSLAASLWGCCVPPQRISAQPPLAQGADPPRGRGDTWSLSRFEPSEDAKLLDGTQQAFSVHFDIASNGGEMGEYEIWLSLGDRVERPFQVAGLGQPDVESLSGEATWSWRAHGRSKVAEVGLYRVDRSASGRTATLTLLQSIQRRYDIVCDPDAPPFERLLKHLFASCLQPVGEPVIPNAAP